MSIAALMATFPYTPCFSYFGHPHVPAQEDVALDSGPELKGVGGGHVYASERAQEGQTTNITKFEAIFVTQNMTFGGGDQLSLVDLRSTQVKTKQYIMPRGSKTSCDITR